MISFLKPVKIPITKPFFGPEEKEAILEPIQTGWVVQGSKVREFETLFARYTGARYALATTSCTTALQLALLAHEIGPGDEVILPSFTWVATANVVEIQGATPVFIDINLDTFNLDPKNLDRAISSRTRAILPVSLFGASAPVEEVLEIAGPRGIPIIEDAACATGTMYKQKHAGAMADAACFSFHARKVITTGEGGMLITSSEKTATLIESLRNHGGSGDETDIRPYTLPEFPRVGFNYRMTDIQGALGVAQMNRLDWILKERRRLADRYNEELGDCKWLKPQSVPFGSTHSYQSYVCLFQPEIPTAANIEKMHQQRNQWMDSLQKEGIATRPGTHSVHLLEFYRIKYGYAPADFPNAHFANQLTITFPLYPQMTKIEQDFVIHKIRQFPG